MSIITATFNRSNVLRLTIDAVRASSFTDVLYDAREGSATHGVLNELVFGAIRPALIVVPPRVWHGIEKPSHTTSTALNLVDRAYDYEDPDHWRLPADSSEIPYQFSRT